MHEQEVGCIRPQRRLTLQFMVHKANKEKLASSWRLPQTLLYLVKEITALPSLEVSHCLSKRFPSLMQTGDCSTFYTGVCVCVCACTRASASKDNIRKWKDNPHNGKRFLQILHLIRSLYLEYIKNSILFKTQWPNFQKQGKNLNRHFPKKIYEWSKANENMSNIISHQENENQQFSLCQSGSKSD